MVVACGPRELSLADFSALLRADKLARTSPTQLGFMPKQFRHIAHRRKISISAFD